MFRATTPRRPQPGSGVQQGRASLCPAALHPTHPLSFCDGTCAVRTNLLPEYQSMRVLGPGPQKPTQARKNRGMVLCHKAQARQRMDHSLWGNCNQKQESCQELIFLPATPPSPRQLPVSLLFPCWPVFAAFLSCNGYPDSSTGPLYWTLGLSASQLQTESSS